MGETATARGNTNNTAVGYNVSVGDSATAVGANAQATALNAVALGMDANASSANATAIGLRAKAVGSQTTAIGNDVPLEEALLLSVVMILEGIAIPLSLTAVM